jgi:hypothetical protein
VKINSAMLGLSVAFFVFASCGKKTEITHLSCLSRENSDSRSEYFIVSNPHLGMDDLLNLLSERLRLLVLNDTAEKQTYFNHFYFDIPCKKNFWYYLGDPCYIPYNSPYQYLLVTIAIQPALNKKKIMIYETSGFEDLKRDMNHKKREITLPWEEKTKN